MAMVSSPGAGSSSYTVTTYGCRVCNMSFHAMSDAEKHVRNSHPEAFRNAYTCSLCNEMFPAKEEAEAHIRARHPEALKPTYTCSLCQQSFSSRESAEIHLRASHPETVQGPHQCPFCREAIQSSEIIAHLKQRHPEFLALVSASSQATAELATKSSTPRRSGSARPEDRDTSNDLATENPPGTPAPWWMFWKRSARLATRNARRLTKQ